MSTGAAPVPVLTLESVTKTYDGLSVVENVSLRVETGERRAVIGPNGAGKTTLLEMVRGRIPPSSGRISLNGRDVTRLADHRRASLGVATTFQRSTLFETLSVEDNVALAVQQRLALSRRILRRRASAAVSDEVARLLDDVGLRQRSQVAAGTLSHGERRQLEVALALATSPRLLLLDEPAAGMSPAERGELVRLIRALPADLTVVVVEHDMEMVFALASRISVLVAGKLLAEGTPDEVAASEDVQRAYLGTVEEGASRC